VRVLGGAKEAGARMIHFILMVNKQGQTRLSQYYEYSELFSGNWILLLSEFLVHLATEKVSLGKRERSFYSQVHDDTGTGAA